MILTLLFFLILVLLLLPFGFEIRAFFTEKEKRVTIYFWFLLEGLRVKLTLQLSRPLQEYLEEVLSFFAKENKTFYIKLFFYLLWQADWELVLIEIGLGLSQAANTAIILGGLWAILFPFLSLKERNRKVQIKFQPQFVEETLKFYSRCIFKLSLGKIFLDYVLFTKKRKGQGYGRATN